MDELIFADTTLKNANDFESIPPECFNVTRKGREILANHPQALTVRERQFLRLLHIRHNQASPVLTELRNKISIGDMLSFGLIEVNTLCQPYKKYQQSLRKSSRGVKQTGNESLNDPIMQLLAQG